jgi:hypothetical protein
MFLQISRYHCKSEFTDIFHKKLIYVSFRCQVLYDYIPQNPDELEIHIGDIINIVEMCDDGWFCGIMETSNHGNKMEFGTFPGNYVKLLPA